MSEDVGQIVLAISFQDFQPMGRLRCAIGRLRCAFDGSADSTIRFSIVFSYAIVFFYKRVHLCICSIFRYF